LVIGLNAVFCFRSDSGEKDIWGKVNNACPIFLSGGEPALAIDSADVIMISHRGISATCFFSYIYDAA